MNKPVAADGRRAGRNRTLEKFETSAKTRLSSHPTLFRVLRGVVYGARGLYGRTMGRGIGALQWRAYRSSAPIRKLHLGCGDLFLPGWFNTDAFPRRLVVPYCDATRRFPFSDGSFDFVYSEHMIEHITYAKAIGMVSECFRVIKPGGRIRISTPDLDKIIALKHPRTDIEKEYVRYANGQIPYAANGNSCFAINAFVRNWGHLFIFDKETLVDLLQRCGFVDIKEYSPGESQSAQLRNLEHHGDALPVREFNLVESMVLEATRPDLTRC